MSNLLSCIKADLSVFSFSILYSIWQWKLHKLQTSESKQHVLNKTVTWTNADTDPAVSYVKGYSAYIFFQSHGNIFF